MKWEKGWFRHRVRQLIYNLFSTAFLTWAIVALLKYKEGTPLDMYFYGFTAAMVGIKVYKKVKESTREIGGAE